MKSIMSLSDQNEECRKRGYKNWIQWIIQDVHGHKNMRPRWEAANGNLCASISKSRWFVQCPCGVGQGINELEPLFFCIDCHNVANDFRPQRVAWENLKDLHMLMGARKDYRQRNYEPHLGETLEHLEIENNLLVKGIYYGVRNS